MLRDEKHTAQEQPTSDPEAKLSELCVAPFSKVETLK